MKADDARKENFFALWMKNDFLIRKTSAKGEKSYENVFIEFILEWFKTSSLQLCSTIASAVQTFFK